MNANDQGEALSRPHRGNDGRREARPELGLARAADARETVGDVARLIGIAQPGIDDVQIQSRGEEMRGRPAVVAADLEAARAPHRSCVVVEDDGLVDREHADVGISPAARIRAPDMRRILAQIRPLQRRGVARDEIGKGGREVWPLQAGRDVIIADAGPDRLRDRLDIGKIDVLHEAGGAGLVHFASSPFRRSKLPPISTRAPPFSSPSASGLWLRIRGRRRTPRKGASAKTRRRESGHDAASSSSPVQDREDRWRSAPPFPGNIPGRAPRG